MNSSSAPSFIGFRTLWKLPGLMNTPFRKDDGNDGRVPSVPGEANLVGSRIKHNCGDDNLHQPVIDLDFPAHLEPSTTPGHFHLYLDKVIRWPEYQRLLSVLYDVGIIGEGYYKMALVRGQTFVRYPGVKKLPGEEHSG